MKEHTIRNWRAYSAALTSGKYEAEHCYYSPTGGGCVLYMRGHNHVEDEIEAAKIFADNGYNVLMTPEDGRNNGLWISKIKKGQPKYADGRLNGKSYEQSTIDSHAVNIPGAFNKALDHAVEKGVKVAVSYDKYGKSNDNDVTQGVAKFTSYPRNNGKVETLYVIRNKEIKEYKI